MFLRALFHLNCAGQDFGICRVMNCKRGMIKQFVTQDLPGAVSLSNRALALSYAPRMTLSSPENQPEGLSLGLSNS